MESGLYKPKSKPNPNVLKTLQEIGGSGGLFQPQLKYNFISTKRPEWTRATHSQKSSKKDFLIMANTTAITDKIERKKIKRAARRKAAPKAPRAGARGANKAKLKKAARGQSKR